MEASDVASYVDAGATCVDELDGNLNRKVHVESQVPIDLMKTSLYPYNITYTCKNHAGISAIPSTRHVLVQDRTCPSCNMLAGPSTIEASFPFSDAGAICKDSINKPIGEVLTFNPVNVESTGTYFVTYRVRDSSKNWNDGVSENYWKQCKGGKVYQRRIVVVDTLRPVVALRYNGHILQVGSHSDVSSSDTPEENPIPFSAAPYGKLMAETVASDHWLAGAIIAGGSGLLVLAAAGWHSRAPSKEMPSI